VVKRRKGLGDFLQSEGKQALEGSDPTPPLAELQSQQDTENLTSRDTSLQGLLDTNLQINVETDLQSLEDTVLLESASRPLYAQLTRKEVRLRDEQYQQLTVLARGLQRAKTQTKERITENTLIRVAIDLLLERGGALIGESEAELLGHLRKTDLS